MTQDQPTGWGFIFGCLAMLALVWMAGILFLVATYKIVEALI